MKEHKVRQNLYHKLADIEDYVAEEEYEVHEFTDEQLVESVVRHFAEKVDTLIYPSKSYFVAIMYAALLQYHFGVDFYEALNDPSLLYDNDKFFVPYNKNGHVYDAILDRIPLTELKQLNHLPQVEATIDYFNKEFMLNPPL